MKIVVISLITFLMAANSIAGITKDEFYSIMELINIGEYDSAYCHIVKIKARSPLDPESYVLGVNYYYRKSMRENLGIVPGPPKRSDPAIVLKDSAGNSIAHFEGITSYDPDTLALGIELLKQGITYFPDRLDMYFGLITITEEAGIYDKMTIAILDILARSKVNNNEWLWSFSEPLLDDPHQFILENIQPRVHALFLKDSPRTDSLFVSLSLAMIGSFPQSTYGHANLGSFYLASGNYEKSLEHLLAANRIDTTDMVTVINLGDVYSMMDNTDRAIECYDKVIRFGNQEERDAAIRRLRELKK